ncbi:MAG: hypothetical protein HND52_03695 [Ignavibacteriae bacterium]|nr:hypothetical protein [Ignavibacteriota bacterium]NOG97059.1 hypothetical protein [Ignavibacteriota bacterium]
MNLKWLRDLDENLLEEEHKEICSLIGIDNFIKIYEKFNRVSIYLSTKSLSRLKKIYIHQHSHLPVKKLARKLEASERFVYQVLDDPPPVEITHYNK